MLQQERNKTVCPISIQPAKKIFNYFIKILIIVVHKYLDISMHMYTMKEYD